MACINNGCPHSPEDQLVHEPADHKGGAHSCSPAPRGLGGARSSRVKHEPSCRGTNVCRGTLGVRIMTQGRGCATSRAHATWARQPSWVGADRLWKQLWRQNCKQVSPEANSPSTGAVDSQAVAPISIPIRLGPPSKPAAPPAARHTAAEAPCVLAAVRLPTLACGHHSTARSRLPVLSQQRNAAAPGLPFPHPPWMMGS
jgi:hypothetical protein